LGFVSPEQEVSAILEVKGLGISFGGLKAVSGFNLALNPGSLQGLIGPNGAGKTTVFNLLSGIYRADTGTFLLSGKELRGFSPARICQAGIARTFQNIRVFPHLSVLENVLVGFHQKVQYGYVASFLRTPRFIDEEKKWQGAALQLLERVGLSSKATESASGLSYGNQRRLEIARALATQPKVLLLDEPAAGLNTTEKADLMNLIAKIRQDFGVAILVIEHDMKLIMGICENITVLDHGEVIAVGEPKLIQSNPKVIEAYLGVE
jgi:branched-chain amino acid transport system ATP-binding protein